MRISPQVLVIDIQVQEIFEHCVKQKPRVSHIDAIFLDSECDRGKVSSVLIDFRQLCPHEAKAKNYTIGEVALQIFFVDRSAKMIDRKFKLLID